MKIVIATNNEHKLTEIRAILGDAFEVVSLADIGCHEDIPETGQTLEENALMKAEYIYDKYHLSCFADDTGLEVEALNGAPGVYSARYAAMEATVPAGSPAGLNPGQRAVLDYIRENPGLRVPMISEGTNIPSKTIERHISVLIELNLIEHLGSKKTGGYYTNNQ